jgi:hypothetical protein
MGEFLHAPHTSIIRSTARYILVHLKGAIRPDASTL